MKKYTIEAQFCDSCYVALEKKADEYNEGPIMSPKEYVNVITANDAEVNVLEPHVCDSRAAGINETDETFCECEFHDDMSFVITGFEEE